jgi:hypothetical protein
MPHWLDGCADIETLVDSWLGVPGPMLEASLDNKRERMPQAGRYQA